MPCRSKLFLRRARLGVPCRCVRQPSTPHRMLPVWGRGGQERHAVRARTPAVVCAHRPRACCRPLAVVLLSGRGAGIHARFEHSVRATYESRCLRVQQCTKQHLPPLDLTVASYSSPGCTTVAAAAASAASGFLSFRGTMWCMNNTVFCDADHSSWVAGGNIGIAHKVVIFCIHLFKIIYNARFCLVPRLQIMCSPIRRPRL